MQEIRSPDVVVVVWSSGADFRKKGCSLLIDVFNFLIRQELSGGPQFSPLDSFLYSWGVRFDFGRRDILGIEIDDLDTSRRLGIYVCKYSGL
jgi:hypothetical protein